MRTKYALSYHTVDKIHDIYNAIFFKTDTAAKKFARGLNRVLESRGYVSISVLCDRAEIDISDDDRDAFDRIAWKDQIDIDTMILPTLSRGDLMYKILFPLVTEIDPSWIEEEDA